MKWPWRKPKKLNETTRLYALYGESANLDYLDNQDKQTIQRVEVVENNLQQTNQNLNQTNQSLNQTNNKVNNLENRLNNLPTIDTTNFAKKNEENTWTKNQYFNTMDVEIAAMRDAVFVRGYIDNVIERDDAIVNRKFVEDENRRLQLDTDNKIVNLLLEHNKFAKLEKENTFTKDNVFNQDVSIKGSTYLQGATWASGVIQCRNGVIIPPDSINNNHSAVNKQYVDNKVAGYVKRFNFFYRSSTIRLNKKDVSPSREMFWYDIHSNQTLSAELTQLTPNTNYYYLILLNTINSKPCETYICSNSGTTNSSGTLRIVGENLGGKTLTSWRDFNPGTTGDFNATLGFKILCIAL